MTLDVGIELLDNVDQIRVPYGDFRISKSTTTNLQVRK